MFRRPISNKGKRPQNPIIVSKITVIHRQSTEVHRGKIFLDNWCFIMQRDDDVLRSSEYAIYIKVPFSLTPHSIMDVPVKSVILIPFVGRNWKTSLLRHVFIFLAERNTTFNIFIKISPFSQLFMAIKR